MKKGFFLIVITMLICNSITAIVIERINDYRNESSITDKVLPSSLKKSGEIANSASYEEKSHSDALIADYDVNVTTKGGDGDVVIDKVDGHIILTATPKNGGLFDKWSDGNTDNPRQITLSQDTTFVAEFVPFITLSEAIDIAKDLSSGQSTNSYYLLQGTVSEVQNVNPDYGNATFYISDGKQSFYCYRVHYLFGENFVSNSQIQVGDVVTIYAQLKRYSNTLETNFGQIRYTNRISMFYDRDYAFTKLNNTDVALYYAGRKEKLSKIEIPNYVKYQGVKYTITQVSGFYGCENLTEIIIPDKITTLGTEAFAACGNLHKVTIGKDVKRFVGEGNRCFADCPKIDTVIWNATNCDDMDWSPFYFARENMKEIIISNDIEWIPANLCWGMAYLRKLDVPAGVTKIGKDAFNGCLNLQTVHIPHKVESIGKSAFKGCIALETLSLGANVSSYGDSVFSDCPTLATINNFREKPAKLGKGAFDRVDYFNCTLYVPFGSLDMYKSTGSDWKDFYFVESINADGSAVETVQVTPYVTTADVAWPKVDGAASYELIIKDVNDVEICSLVFNAQGQLTSITFRSPSKNKDQQHFVEQAAGFSFTITGLQRASKYNYSLNTKDNDDKIIDSKIGTFYTEGYDEDINEAIDEMTDLKQLPIQKILHNGQLFIIRDGKTYSVQGAEVH